MKRHPDLNGASMLHSMRRLILVKIKHNSPPHSYQIVARQANASSSLPNYKSLYQCGCMASVVLMRVLNRIVAMK